MPRLAVLGQPVSHSRSPAMHNAALADMGLFPEWTYEAIEVAPEDFEARVRAMEREGFAGANVTIPHKLAALALADSASVAAREIGAANTLSFRAGSIEAENTDATGIVAALPRPPAGMRALVLGAGGSARAAVWALLGAGARVAIWNRTPERAEGLAERFGADVERAEGELALAGYDLIVNATIVGLERANRDLAVPESDLGVDPDRAGPGLKHLPLSADAIIARHVVVDLVYGAAETQLIAAARARGADVVEGLEVLVRQGAAALRMWTGIDPPVEIMREAARDMR